jgi:hypothetical protein
MSGRGEAWYRARFGTERSEVRILSPRLDFAEGDAWMSILFLFSRLGVFQNRKKTLKKPRKKQKL